MKVKGRVGSQRYNLDKKTTKITRTPAKRDTSLDISCGDHSHGVLKTDKMSNHRIVKFAIFSTLFELKGCERTGRFRNATVWYKSDMITTTHVKRDTNLDVSCGRPLWMPMSVLCRKHLKTKLCFFLE